MKRYLAIVAALVALHGPAWARGGGGFSGGGGRSFSGGGSHSYSAPRRSYSAPSVPSPGRSYSAPSSGNAAPHSSGYTTAYDSGASSAAARQASGTAYRAANPQHWARPDTATRIASIPSERLATRAARSETVYHVYRTQPVPGWIQQPYHDPFGNAFFWMWLMDSSHRSERDEWVYHHRDEIDPARYEELKRQDADLERRVSELETAGIPRNRDYMPPGMDADLAYSDEAIAAVHTKSFPWGWVFLGSCLGLAMVGGLVYARTRA